jgi:hypothetical protein
MAKRKAFDPKHAFGIKIKIGMFDHNIHPSGLYSVADLSKEVEHELYFTSYNFSDSSAKMNLWDKPGYAKRAFTKFRNLIDGDRGGANWNDTEATQKADILKALTEELSWPEPVVKIKQAPVYSLRPTPNIDLNGNKTLEFVNLWEHLAQNTGGGTPSYSRTPLARREGHVFDKDRIFRHLMTSCWLISAEVVEVTSINYNTLEPAI